MSRRPTTTLLAGWLFADIFLGVTFVALASDPGLPPTEVEAPSEEPNPEPELPPGVEQHPVTVTVPSVDVPDAELLALFAEPLSAGRRAAFVLTFGVAEQPGAGVQLARDTNARLRAALPHLLDGAAQRDFWQAVNPVNPRPGAVRVELYLFTPTRGETP